jgi:hypothetical protein
MPKIPFKVSARTAKLIGLENFSNEEGAIVELVKNTYDADSKNCVLIFDLVFNQTKNDEGEILYQTDKHNSKIYIIDNGIGMTEDVITNQWMTIGTDDKLYEHLSDNGRVKTGAKGIGRFALNRLGLITELKTISKKTKEGLFWKVNWNDFEQSGTMVSDVKADLESRNNLDLKIKILKKFYKNEKLKNLLNELSFETGTIIEISELNDNWETSQLNNLFSNLEMLLPPKEQSDFEIHFFSNTDEDNYGKVKTAYYDDYDYKVEAQYNGIDNGNIEIKITRNELDVEVIENRYSEIFDYDTMKKYPYRLEDFKTKTIKITKALNSILADGIDHDLISKVGKFGFSFYFLKNTISDDKQDDDLKKYPYKGFSSANRKAWLKKFGGVKIFRDDFRIRPYGENGQDWLKLGERQSQSPGGAGQRLGGYRIRPNQIAGTINISRIHNINFQDKSGREGIIENEVFLLFENIIKEIITFFEKDRNTIMFHFSELYKKKNKEAEAKQKAQEEAKRITEEKEENKTADDTSTNTEESWIQVINATSGLNNN